MAVLGLQNDDVVTVRSRGGSVIGIVESDETLRRGCITMTHGFGGHGLEAEGNPYSGSNVNLLISTDENLDPISGIPRMSNVPVAIERQQECSTGKLQELPA
jgi:anaerobic selenocysteine-containing dehydrogenase